MKNQQIDFSKITSIHFVGIKGVGMTPLAIIAKEAGFQVSGCDTADIFITDIPLKKSGIDNQIGFSAEHLANIDLIITTGAHGGFDNPEIKAAKEQKIPVVTQGEALGIFMKGEIFGKDFFGISIAGCHGKTTTTAMIATLFMQTGLDPSYVIGTSNIIPIGMPGHFGSGTYFIAEADEYATEPKYDHTPKFMWQHPDIAVFTNIEHDHPDIYPTIEDTREAFFKFAKSLERDGLLIAFGDDPQVRKLLREYTSTRVTYGFATVNDYVIRNIHVENGQTFFQIDTKELSLGEFKLNVIGEHNVLNATAAIIVGIECGLRVGTIQQNILAFKGTQRRFEMRGKLPSGALLIDDYGHHPTEIKKTLRAARDQFKKNYIVCIFEPHTYSRTKLLFDEFSSSFINADEVILTDIYPSARETPDPSVSSAMLSQAVKKFNKNVLFLPKLPDVVKYIKQKNFGENAVIITMGAGDIYKVGDELLLV
ncbi:MAG TPA: UDP-N-acetylmuramate--L-alanine ligase [Candidatus Saccharimonadales bacterium]|nr:UDP-N-acetylmuramate--L-alanine ligase [Candidatus Saccharimonadales bacterium]